MVVFLLAIPVAVAAGLLGGSSGYHLWRKLLRPGLTQYDFVLHMECDEIFNDLWAKNPIRWELGNDRESFNQIDAVTVSLIGGFNEGKTFLLNQLADIRLESKFQTRTLGLSFKAAQIKSERKLTDVMFIDTEGSDFLPENPYDMKRITFKKNYDRFIREMAVQLADLVILLLEKPDTNSIELIQVIGGLIKSKGGNMTLIVVYNHHSIEKAADLMEFFKDLVKKYKCVPYIPWPSTGVLYYCNSMDISGSPLTIVHLPLGKEGSEAGQMYNKSAYDCIKHLIGRRREFQGENRLSFSMMDRVMAQKALFEKYLTIRVEEIHESNIPNDADIKT